MLRFIAARVLQFPFILAVIYVVTFLLAWVAPGSPFEGEKKVDAAVIDRLKHEFHAENAWTFLGYYPLKIIRDRDLGPSMFNPELGVNEIIASSLPISMTLGAVAVLIAVVFGVAIGTLAAVKRGGAFDWLSLTVALVGI